MTPTPVIVGSEIFGDVVMVARLVTAEWVEVEAAEPLPLGAVVTVHFLCVRGDGQTDEMVARAVVRRLSLLNVADGCARRIGLRVLDHDDRPPLDLPGASALH